MPTTLLLGERSPARPHGKKSLWKAGLLAGYAAALVNAVIFGLFVGAGVFPALTRDPGVGARITIEPVALASLIGVLCGVVVFGLLRHVLVEPIRPFLWLAGGVLVVSFVAPLAVPEAAVLQAIALNLLHVVTAAAVLLTVVWLGRR